MSESLKLPELGENIKGGDIVKWLVKAGDALVKDQPLLELETGKATVEVPSPVAGKVTRLLAQVGEKIEVGQAVLEYDSDGGAAAADRKPTPATSNAPAAAPEPKAPAPPVLIAPEAAPEPVMPPPAAATAPSGTPAIAAPSVRYFAREIGVEIGAVKGSGPGGRITLEDVKRHARQANTGRTIQTHCALEQIPLPDFAKWGPVRKEAMSTIRVATAEHLSRCWATIPHVTQFDKADITELEALRRRFAPRAEAAGAKLTVTAILIKTLAAALKVFPKFNAAVDMRTREIYFKQYIHIGVAVDTERGLLVPVLRDADRKNIIQIAVELAQLADRARHGKLGPADLQGGTFTVTNLGGIGGSFFTPIINGPEVAILGVNRAAREPVFAPDSDAVRPRLMLPLSLSYDHRLIDGADGARFLRWVIEALEQPMLITLEG